MGNGRECQCTPPDTCAAEPGGLGCACAPATSGSCEPQYVCATDDEGASTCQPPSAEECGGVEGCRCAHDLPCAEGFECNFMFRVCQAAPGSDCRIGCTCSGPDTTDDGCPAGESCHPMGFGSECRPDEAP
jgi:hypothetical protein